MVEEAGTSCVVTGGCLKAHLYATFNKRQGEQDVISIDVKNSLLLRLDRKEGRLWRWKQYFSLKVNRQLQYNIVARRIFESIISISFDFVKRTRRCYGFNIVAFRELHLKAGIGVTKRKDLISFS